VAYAGRSAWARSLDQAGGTNTPVPPGITTSATALSAVATTGPPLALASIIAVGRSS
jgi:hypothetical protein